MNYLANLQADYDQWPDQHSHTAKNKLSIFWQIHSEQQPQHSNPQLTQLANEHTFQCSLQTPEIATLVRSCLTIKFQSFSGIIKLIWMGKRLRSREISNQSDFENEIPSTNHLNHAKLSQNTLKKAILKKFAPKGPDCSRKHTNYRSKVQAGSICAIVDQARFECPICLQLLVRPCLLACGHMYCQKCLECNSVHSNNCCICRAQQKEQTFIPSSFAQTMINQLILPNSTDIFKYLCRTTDASEWLKRRTLTYLRVGMLLDFQDAFGMWKKAMVLSISGDSQGRLMVTVKSHFKGNIIQENIEATSRRLAPLHFFTCYKYLEQFTPILPESTPRDNELSSLEYRNPKPDSEMFDLDNYSHNYSGEMGGESENAGGQWVEQDRVQEALALFNWEMEGVEVIM